MGACNMIVVMLLLLVATVEFQLAQGTPDAKKFSCQGQSGSSLGPASDCILKVADQAKTITKLQGDLGVLDASSKAQTAQIQQLQSSVKDLSKKVTQQETNLTSLDAKYASEVSTLRSEIKKATQTSNTLTNKVTQLGNQVRQISGAWPSGKYCILASGSCPSGFTRSSAYMRAISLFSGNSNYINQGTFGDSKIECHGRCGQYGHWTGELYITACCR